MIKAAEDQMTSARRKAQDQFAKTKPHVEEAIALRDKSRVAEAEKTARLRALRVAKDVADKEAADKAAAVKTASKRKNTARAK